ncbi:hypothetical protein EV359DRAFT_86555 [Lentinula novae-zelandiae]|nr:hypothetical protein EV359DRAFT_86555 [Lentinula novae-zelandiae]
MLLLAPPRLVINSLLVISNRSVSQRSHTAPPPSFHQLPLDMSRHVEIQVEINFCNAQHEFFLRNGIYHALKTPFPPSHSIDIDLEQRNLRFGWSTQADNGIYKTILQRFGLFSSRKNGRVTVPQMEDLGISSMSLYRRKVGTILRTRIGHLICPAPAPIPPSPPLASYSPVTLPLMVSPPPSPYQGFGILSQPTSSGVVQSNHNLPGFSNGINHSPAHQPNALNTVQPGSSCQVQQSNISPSTSNSQPRSSHDPRTNHTPGDTPFSEAPRIPRADLGSGGVLVTTAPVAKESTSSLSTSVKAGRNNLTSSSSLPSSHRFIPPPIAVPAKVQTGKNISPVSTTRHPLPLIPSPPTIWSVPIPRTMGSNISSSQSFNLPPRPNVPVPSKPASSTTATRVNLSLPASSSSTYSVKYGMQHLVLDSNGNAIKPSSSLTRSKAEFPIKSSTPSISRLPTSGTVPHSPAPSLPPMSSSNIARPRTGPPALGSKSSPLSSPVLSLGLPLSTTNPQTTTNGNPLAQGAHSALRSPHKLKKSEPSEVIPRTSVSIMPSAISLPRPSSTSVLPLEPRSSTHTFGPPRVERVVPTSAKVDTSKNRNDNPPNGVKSLPQVPTGQQLFSPNSLLMPQGINISITRTLPVIPPTSNSISSGSQAPPEKTMSSSASVSGTPWYMPKNSAQHRM